MNRTSYTNNPHAPEARTTADGYTIRKRHTTVAGIPFGRVVASGDPDGPRYARVEDGWQDLDDGTVYDPAALVLPLFELKPNTPGVHLDRAARRRVERVAAKAQNNLSRARIRRERAEYLDSFKATGPIVEATA
jgi:hypothetical protein